MVKRSRKEIMESAVYDGIFQMSDGDLAILELLLDIRDQNETIIRQNGYYINKIMENLYNRVQY